MSEKIENRKESTHHRPKSKGVLATLRALVPKRPLVAFDVGQITERQAARLRRVLDVTDANFPIEALGQIPRIELRADDEIPSSGMSLWDGTSWVILVNTSEPIEHQRFSILHELHHVICHTTTKIMFDNTDTHAANAEQTADYFAACVLMPKKLMKRHWGEGPRTIAAMARRFEVSTHAMSHRLNQMGLHEPEYQIAWDENAYEQSNQRTTHKEAA